MGALIHAGLLAPAAVVAPAHIDPAASWQAEIAAASWRFGVPERWIRVVIQLESAGRTVVDGTPIRSPKGAIGLMQLMPATWADMRARHGLGLDPDMPADNILAGTAYLRFLYDQLGYPGLFAAYNAGPARYLAWRDRGVPLPPETQAYLAAALRMLEGDARLPAPRVLVEGPAPWRTLFVPLGPGTPAAAVSQ